MKKPRNIVSVSKADAEILRNPPEPLKILIPVTIEPELCACGRNPASSVLQPCVYDEDVNNDSMPKCFCCSACRTECSNEI